MLEKHKIIYLLLLFLIALQLFTGPCRFLGFLILYIFGKAPWPWTSPLQASVCIQDNINKQIFVPPVRFELTTPLFEQAKTVHVLDYEQPL
jgi:hypothetical protein